MTKDDLVMAFFPCTRFEAQVLLWFLGNNYSQETWDDVQKLEYNLQIHKELSENYELITKLAIIILRRGLRMVFENPYSPHHYLTRYWCLKPQIIDMDRTERGDYYTKPTQYWFIGFEPHHNIIFEPMEYVEMIKVANQPKGIKRSLIHPQYANRFIREFIL